MKETVIDFHVHLTDYEDMTEDIFDFFASPYPSKEEYADFCKKYSDYNNFIKLMDQNGVDFSVVLAEIAPLTSGIASNERVIEFCKSNSRLIPFCTLNPYIHSNMGKKLEELCINQGFKGIKLYPSYNYFYPNDNFMYPLYAVAERLDIPVLFHTGTSVFSNSRLKYSNPIYIDDVAIDFPNMKIIMSHGGRGPWYDVAFYLVRLHKNVYIDITGLPPKKLMEYFPDLGRFAYKFVFGTDWPAIDVKKNINTIRNLNISNDGISKILGGNAMHLLGLAKT
jgi:hypothetical protein